MSEPWHLELRALRDVAGLTRGQLASRAAVSSESIRAYETGRRHPARPTLAALLDALAAEPIRRHQILEDAGYVADGGVVGRSPQGRDYSLKEASVEIMRYPWPAHLNNEMFEVLDANPLMQAVWGVDMASERSTPMERSFVVAMSTPLFADHIVNWDELMALLSSMLKGSHSEDGVAADGPNPYLASIAQYFLMGDPVYVQRFLTIWADAPPLIQKRRFACPMLWQHDELGRMNFWIVVNPANIDDYMTFCEWLPTDSQTWQKLETLQARVDR